jgi:transposase
MTRKFPTPLGKSILQKWGNSTCKKHSGSGNVAFTPEEAKMRKLERENRELKEDIEILKKAATYFAKSLR